MVDPGKVALQIPGKYMKMGIPRVIVHYCSDKYDPIEDEDYDLYAFETGKLRYGGTDPRFQISCRTGPNLLEYYSIGFVNYLSLFFTDNNTDAYITPNYAIFTLIII